MNSSTGKYAHVLKIIIFLVHILLLIIWVATILTILLTSLFTSLQIFAKCLDSVCFYLAEPYVVILFPSELVILLT